MHSSQEGAQTYERILLACQISTTKKHNHHHPPKMSENRFPRVGCGSGVSHPVSESLRETEGDAEEEQTLRKGLSHHAVSLRCWSVLYGRGCWGNLQFITVPAFSEPQGKERTDRKQKKAKGWGIGGGLDPWFYWNFLGKSEGPARKQWPHTFNCLVPEMIMVNAFKGI